jgi:peptide/nickel transport system permease protein
MSGQVQIFKLFPKHIILKSHALELLNCIRGNTRMMVGSGLIFFLFLIAIFAPFVAPNDPIEQHRGHYLQPPSWQYPFGTDDLGRCIFSRLVYGTQISLLISVAVVGTTATIGTSIGLISGFAGGGIDEAIMRIVDILLAFPGLVLALVIAGLLGPGIFSVILALTIVGWTGYARVVRGCVLAEKERGFVEATRVLGGSKYYIMIRHIMPGVLAPVVVMAALGMGGTILSASALGFLGLGLQPPAPEWGSMLNGGRTFLQLAPYCMIFPGLAIMLTVLAFNLLGDGLRDIMDPWKKKRLEI